ERVGALLAAVLEARVAQRHEPEPEVHARLVRRDEPRRATRVAGLVEELVLLPAPPVLRALDDDLVPEARHVDEQVVRVDRPQREARRALDAEEREEREAGERHEQERGEEVPERGGRGPRLARPRGEDEDAPREAAGRALPGALREPREMSVVEEEERERD